MSDQIFSHTVLVVDDEPANLRMMERLLRRKYRVITATGGHDALDILKREESVSLLITDHRMPGMSGIELLRESHLVNSDLMRIIVTANTETDTFMEAINDAGALRVIHKPWDPDKVLQFVQEALEQRETFIECKQANAQLEQAMDQLKRAAEGLNLFANHE